MEQPFKGLFLIFCIPSQVSECFGGEKEIRSIVRTNILKKQEDHPALSQGGLHIIAIYKYLILYSKTAVVYKIYYKSMDDLHCRKGFLIVENTHYGQLIFLSGRLN